MNARTFGKKGSSTPGGGGETAAVSRRAAFLAQERARAGGESRAADTEVFPVRPTTIADRIEFVDKPKKERAPVGPRSYPLTWILWFITGLAGVHRLYLGRYITGAIQAALFIGCVTLVFGFQRYPAYLGLAISWLWMLVDGLSLKAMYAEAVGRPRNAATIEIA